LCSTYSLPRRPDPAQTSITESPAKGVKIKPALTGAQFRRPDRAQEGRAAGGDALRASEACARLPPEREADAPEPRVEMVRAPPVDGHEVGQPLTEDLARAGRVEAEELACPHLQNDSHAAPGEVGHLAVVMAVDGGRAPPTEGAGGRAADGGDGEREMLVAHSEAVDVETP